MNSRFKILVPFIFLLFFSKYACSQTPEPVSLTSDRALQKAEILKLQMRDDLKLTPSKFDSVMRIQNEYKTEQRLILKNKTLLADERNKRMKAIEDKKNKALKNTSLDDAEIKRVESYFLNK